MMSLEVLEKQLIANLQDSQNSAREYQWDRARIYYEMRQHFPSDPKLGQYLKELLLSPRGESKVESNDERAQLIWAFGNLTREQFLAIGSRPCRALKKVKPWKQNPEAMRQLIQQAADARMGLRAIEAAVKAIEEEQPIPEVEVEFFSPLQSERELQRRLLNSDTMYACEFFGSKELILDMGDLKRRWRKLSAKYHPDKQGGSDWAMQTTNEVYIFLKRKIELKTLQDQTLAMMQGQQTA